MQTILLYPRYRYLLVLGLISTLVNQSPWPHVSIYYSKCPPSVESLIQIHSPISIDSYNKSTTAIFLILTHLQLHFDYIYIPPPLYDREAS